MKDNMKVLLHGGFWGSALGGSAEFTVKAVQGP